METKAQVCGIYQDESETPRIYMSYEVAHKLFGAQFTGTNVAFLLTNKGAVEEVSAKLRKQNFSVGANTDTSLAWNLLEQQTWQTFLVSVVFVVCSAMLTREKIVQEKRSAGGEYTCLLATGLTEGKVGRIIPLRILMLEAATMCFVQLTAAASGRFYHMAFALELVYMAVHYCVCLLGLQHGS